MENVDDNMMAVDLCVVFGELTWLRRWDDERRDGKDEETCRVFELTEASSWFGAAKWRISVVRCKSL